MYRRAPLVAPPGTRLHERRCTVWSCYNSHTHHTVLYCTSQEALPVRHWGEPGQRYRYKQASKQAMLTGTVPVGSLTTIQTHQQHTTCTSARRPKPRPTQQPQLARCPGRPEPTAPRGRLRRGRLQRTRCLTGRLPRCLFTTPPSIAIEALVLGGPEDVRVALVARCVEQQQQETPHARCVEQQQRGKDRAAYAHGCARHAQRGACSETTWPPPSDSVRSRGECGTHPARGHARGAYAAAAIARACCGSCGCCEQRSYWYLCYTFGGRGAPDWRRCYMLVRRSLFPQDSPNINGLCSHEFFVLARAVSATPPSIVKVALVLGGPERMRVVLNSSRGKEGDSGTDPNCAVS
jgi:hypothetical protein